MKDIIVRAKDLTYERYMSLSDALIVATYQVCGTLRPLKILTHQVEKVLDNWMYENLYEMDAMVWSSNTQNLFLDELLSFILYPDKKPNSVFLPEDLEAESVIV